MTKTKWRTQKWTAQAFEIWISTSTSISPKLPPSNHREQIWQIRWRHSRADDCSLVADDDYSQVRGAETDTSIGAVCKKKGRAKHREFSGYRMIHLCSTVDLLTRALDRHIRYIKIKVATPSDEYHAPVVSFCSGLHALSSTVTCIVKP